MPLLKCSAGKATPRKAISYITNPQKAALVSVRNLFEYEDYAKQFEETAAMFGKGQKYDERKYYHFKLSCARQDKVTPREAQIYAEELAAKAANCEEFVDKLPNGYETKIGENGAKLSGGERQRISIARALLKNAPIVLLDEATASLDVENETKVQEALSRLLSGKTVLVIAHRMRTVEAADKIVVLENGSVAEEGSPKELMAKSGLFAHMVELQRKSAEWHSAT